MPATCALNPRRAASVAPAFVHARVGALDCPSRWRGVHPSLRRLAALASFWRCAVSGLVGFCSSRFLPSSASALVARVVGSVLAAERGVGVGCALGGDALVVSSVLAWGSGASSRLSVFATFGLVSPPWPASCVSAPGASSSVSSVSGVAAALSAGASVSWRGGRPRRPPRRPSCGPVLGLGTCRRRFRRGTRPCRVRLLALPGRSRPLVFSLGLLLRLRLRVVGVPRARRRPRAPRRRFPGPGLGPQ